ncbi:MAG: hypothetical protein IJY94_07135 [Clostridia bacterium]|nr:hypothetical protein [Clostridia bacterium]
MKAIKLLSLLLVISLLTSCGIIVINDGKEKGETVSVTTEEETTYTPNDYDTKPLPDYEDEAKELLNALPDKDFGGHTVVIATDEGSSSIWDDVEGPYVSAVLKRNSFIADKYNTVVSSSKTTTDALYQAVKQSHLSNDFYADFASIKSSELGTYYGSGSIQNFKALTYRDFTAPYFNEKAIDQMTLGGVIYGVVGSMTESPESYGCLFFNKTLGREIGINIDYKSVYNHEFTWDKLFAQIASAKTENAILTSSYDNQTLSNLALLSAGQTYFSRNESGSFVSNFNTDVSQTVITNLKKLIPYRADTFTDKNTVTNENGSESTVETVLTGLDIFIKGRALLSVGTVSDMKKIANCGFEWEILPIPKLTEGGPYNAAVSDTAPVLVFLGSSHNVEQNGYILQALGASSYKHLQGSYVKYAMDHYVSSYYTFDMLELIIENPVYDHALMFGKNYSQLRNGTYNAFYNAVITENTLTYCINKTKANLQKYLDAAN